LIFNIIAKDNTSSTFSKIKAGAAVAGAAIGAVLMSGVHAAIEKSKIDNLLAAQLGATPAQAKVLGQVSGKVYAQGFGEDLPQVSDQEPAHRRSGPGRGLVAGQCCRVADAQDRPRQVVRRGDGHPRQGDAKRRQQVRGPARHDERVRCPVQEAGA
jgi:hypothetical protein